MVNMHVILWLEDVKHVHNLNSISENKSTTIVLFRWWFFVSKSIQSGSSYYLQSKI